MSNVQSAFNRPLKVHRLTVRLSLSLMLMFSSTSLFAADPSEISKPEVPLIKTAAEWQGITTQDLAYIYKTTLEAHPGIIDKQNPHFKDWLVAGFAKAKQRIPQVRNQQDELAVLRFYTAGFQDGHVSIRPIVDQKKPDSWAGWLIEKQGPVSSDRFVVKHAQTNWPMPTPPNDAQIISCDSLSPNHLIEKDIAPFIDTRLTLESSWEKLANHLMTKSDAVPILNRHLIDNCIVLMPDQTQKIFPLSWQVDEGALALLLKQPKPLGLSDLGQDRYWVNASNFYPNAEENIQFDQLIHNLGQLGAAKLVVLDVRGNTGGNSEFGSRILAALLGSTGRLKDSSETTAWWRVSKQAISSRDVILSMVEKNYGKKNRFIYLYAAPTSTIKNC